MAGLMDGFQWLSEGEKAERAAQLKNQPKVPLSMEGSKVPESATKAAQKFLAQKGHPSAWGVQGAGDVGKGLMGKLGAGAKALGPLGAAYQGGEELNKMFGKGAWDNAQIAAEEGQTRRAMEEDPELAGRGQETAGRINEEAMAGVYGLMSQANAQRPEDVQPGLTKDEMDMPNPADAPPQPQVTPEQAQEIQQVQRAQAERQQEATRQTLEKGVTEGLKTGKTSVSELAKGLAQADAQRAGVEMTPEEEKKAVTAEIQTLKTMPQSDMARYVSYALVAGGLLAAALDKSGKAGDAFSDSFNKQLDRNLVAGKMNLQAQQAAVKAAQEDRKIKATEDNTASMIDNRKAMQDFRGTELGQLGRKVDIAEEQLGVNKFKANTDASQGAQKIGLMASGQETTRRGQDLNYKLGQDRISAANTRADKKLQAAGNTDKGVPMSYKDSKEIVGEVYKAQGLTADAGVTTAIASRLPTLQKKYPQMSASELVELAQGEMSVSQDPTWYPGGNDRVKVKKSN